MPLRSIADSKETNIRFTEFNHELQYSKSTVHRYGFLRIIENCSRWSTVQLVKFNDCCHHSTLHMFNLFWSKYQLSSNDAEDFLYYYCIPLFDVRQILSIVFAPLFKYKLLLVILPHYYRPTTTWVPMTWLNIADDYDEWWIKRGRISWWPCFLSAKIRELGSFQSLCRR